MAQVSTRTIHHTNLEIKRALNIQPFTVDNHSTINQKYSTGLATPPTTGFPLIKYLMVGRGGHSYVTGASGVVSDILRHGPTDAVLFDAIPFVVTPVTADLDPLTRAKYRLRVLETINGTDYFCYYIKVIDITGIAPVSNIVTVSAGTITNETPYTPAVSSMSPVPVATPSITSGTHITVQANLSTVLNATDIAALLNAVEIKWGDRRYATISEVAFVSGFDAPGSTSTLGGSSITYTEIQAAQVMNFNGTEMPFQHQPNSITLNYSIGNTAPLPPPV